jgi:hypothetical protein
MDTGFFEFWSQAFMNMAKGQRQVDEFNRWMQQGFSGSESLSELFRQIYGLDRVEKSSDEYGELYEKASQTFRQSFREYLRLFDVVPRQEHDELIGECEALKKKVSAQEITIAHLRKILGEKGMDSVEAVQDLQDVLKKQTDQFQEMMQTMGQVFKPKRPQKSK